MNSPDEREEKVYENHRRNRHLHAFKRIAFIQGENLKIEREIQGKLLEMQRNNDRIKVIQDNILDWILHETRKEDKPDE